MGELRYNCALTTDGVVFYRDKVLLIRRKNPPFQGEYALPGGFVDPNEPVEEACVREVMEETGLAIGQLQFIGVYSSPGRDPRGRTVSVAFLGEASSDRIMAGDDAAEAEWVGDWKSLNLAFDHRQILLDAERILYKR